MSGLDVYRDELIDAAQHPHHYGKLDGADVSTQKLNPSCGDSVEVFLKLDKAGKKIMEIGWEGQGCVISRASMSLLADELVGKTLDEVQAMDKSYLQSLLGFNEGIAPGREKCMMLGLVAVQGAVGK